MKKQSFLVGLLALCGSFSFAQFTPLDQASNYNDFVTQEKAMLEANLSQAKGKNEIRAAEKALKHLSRFEYYRQPDWMQMEISQTRLLKTN